MSIDSTAIRISGYFGLIWLAGGLLAALHHFHSLTPLHIAASVVVAVLTIMGFVAITYTDRLFVKLIAEPLTAAGVLGSGVGYLLYLGYPVVTLIAGAIVLGILGASLYDNKQEHARKAQNKDNMTNALNLANAKIRDLESEVEELRAAVVK